MQALANQQHQSSDSTCAVDVGRIPAKLRVQAKAVQVARGGVPLPSSPNAHAMVGVAASKADEWVRQSSLEGVVSWLAKVYAWGHTCGALRWSVSFCLGRACIFLFVVVGFGLKSVYLRSLARRRPLAFECSRSQGLHPAPKDFCRQDEAVQALQKPPGQRREVRLLVRWWCICDICDQGSS